MDWARVLAYVTGTVDQELLARNEYLAAENRILKAQLTGRLKLSDANRKALGEIGHRLGRPCHVAERRTQRACVPPILSRLRLPRAKCPSPRRESRGAFGAEVRWRWTLKVL